MCVRDHLYFHVAGAAEKLFDVDRRVAEGAARLFPREREGLGDVTLSLDNAHAAPAAAAGSFQDDWITDLLCDLPDRLRVLREGLIRPRHAGHASRSHRALRRDLVAHRPDAGRTRADEDQSRVGDPLGEVGVLGQKSITRMDRLCPRGLRAK